MKKPNCKRMLWLLLMLGITSCNSSSKISSPKSSEIVRLYSLPPVLKIQKGAEIPTADGIVVAPEDTLLHSHGSYMEQVQRAIRP